MRMAINMEQIGSAIIQPKAHIKMELTITPTEPNVSAKMCRKTPSMICEFPPVGASPPWLWPCPPWEWLWPWSSWECPPPPCEWPWPPPPPEKKRIIVVRHQTRQIWLALLYLYRESDHVHVGRRKSPQDWLRSPEHSRQRAVRVSPPVVLKSSPQLLRGWKTQWRWGRDHSQNQPRLLLSRSRSCTCHSPSILLSPAKYLISLTSFHVGSVALIIILMRLTDAARPARRPVQSKNMWKESEIRPRELVATP